MRSAARLLETISAPIIKHRAHFGQTITPARGSVVASTQLAAYDPDPDYFFHWYRDAALAMEALRILHADGTVDRALAERHFADFVRFSLSLAALDGRGQPLPAAQPGFEKYLRRDLASAHGAAIAGETRVNPDGSLDISDWPRPQHDGPALRALAVLRWMEKGCVPEGAEALLRADLAFVTVHARRPCFDIWEEELGLHYYTLRVSAAALLQGAGWLEQKGDAATARRCFSESQRILKLLRSYWRGTHYGSRLPKDGEVSPKDLDIAVVLAAIHAGGEGFHSPRDPRLLRTLDRLEALFDSSYAINHDRPRGRAPAMGRYAGDTYYSGGAYYFATLGAAEFCYRAGERARGDAFLETVRAFTPDNGDLSEQFDRNTGAQTSSKQLGWSHAALITCVAARPAAG
ncbi:MAG TPA: glycoside hydrolase family 15 protein [Rhizomicrobium sp.]|nr:glycoside hydrolase family 15 protein [Rhizomicrobium sp.]